MGLSEAEALGLLGLVGMGVQWPRPFQLPARTFFQEIPNIGMEDIGTGVPIRQDSEMRASELLETSC